MAEISGASIRDNIDNLRLLMEKDNLSIIKVSSKENKTFNIIPQLTSNDD